jgi:hypothetical protein
VADDPQQAPMGDEVQRGAATIGSPADVIATALAGHQQSYEIDGEYPTEFHGYAHAVIGALRANGFVIIPGGPASVGRALCLGVVGCSALVHYNGCPGGES